MMDSTDMQAGSDPATATNAVPCTLVAKWGKRRIVIPELTVQDTIGKVKQRLKDETGVLEKRQKLIGLAAVQGGAKAVNDDLVLGDLKIKTKSGGSEAGPIVHEFILMGTAEKDIFVDPSERDDLPDVIDDFDLDFNVRVSSAETMSWRISAPLSFGFGLLPRSFLTLYCFPLHYRREAVNG
jgi:ubiquitin-like domain-containing CTD phosphatase 1